MVKDRLGHDGALACWCWKRFRSSRTSHKFAGPGLYVVSRKRYLASDQHILLKIFWIWTLSLIILILWILFGWNEKVAVFFFTEFTYTVPSKSNHWIWRATLAGCKNASLLCPGTPCPQGTWSERGGITSVLDCKNCDERRENWTGMTGVVRSPMVDYLRSLRQNPDGCIPYRSS